MTISVDTSTSSLTRRSLLVLLEQMSRQVRHNQHLDLIGVNERSRLTMDELVAAPISRPIADGSPETAITSGHPTARSPGRSVTVEPRSPAWSTGSSRSRCTCIARSHFNQGSDWGRWPDLIATYGPRRRSAIGSRHSNADRSRTSTAIGAGGSRVPPTLPTSAPHSPATSARSSTATPPHALLPETRHRRAALTVRGPLELAEGTRSSTV